MNKPLPSLGRRKPSLPPGIATGVAIALVAGFFALQQALELAPEPANERPEPLQSHLDGQAFPLPAASVLDAQLIKAQRLCQHPALLQAMSMDEKTCSGAITAREADCRALLLAAETPMVSSNEQAGRLGKQFISCLMSP